MFPQPVDQFYEAPARLSTKKKGKEPLEPLKRTSAALTKPSSKVLKIGKKLKENRLNDFPLLKLFTDATLYVEDLDEDDFLLKINSLIAGGKKSYRWTMDTQHTTCTKKQYSLRTLL